MWNVMVSRYRPKYMNLTCYESRWLFFRPEMIFRFDTNRLVDFLLDLSCDRKCLMTSSQWPISTNSSFAWLTSHNRPDRTRFVHLENILYFRGAAIFLCAAYRGRVLQRYDLIASDSEWAIWSRAHKFTWLDNRVILEIASREKYWRRKYYS